MKVKWGMMMVDGRGKLGGHVMSKSRSGATVRTKVSPSNAQTSAQTVVRNRLSAFAQDWRGLTAVQRAAWNSAVDGFKSTNIFGDIISPSGMNLYVKLNCNLAIVGVSAIAVPPLPTGVSEPTSATLTADDSDQTLSVAIAPDPVPAGTAFVFEATAPMSAGISNYKGKFRFIQYADAADTSPVALTTAYLAKYGAIAEGQKIAVRVYAVNKVTGEVSIPIVTDSLVVA